MVTTNPTPTNTHILREHANYRPLSRRAIPPTPEPKRFTEAMVALAAAVRKSQTTSKSGRCA